MIECWSNQYLQAFRRGCRMTARDFIRCHPECLIAASTLFQHACRLLPRPHPKRSAVLTAEQERWLHDRALRAFHLGRPISDRMLLEYAIELAQERRDGELDDLGSLSRVWRCRPALLSRWKQSLPAGAILSPDAGTLQLWSNLCFEDICNDRVTAVHDFMFRHPECPIPYPKLEALVTQMQLRAPIPRRPPLLTIEQRPIFFERLMQLAKSGTWVSSELVLAVLAEFARERRPTEFDDSEYLARASRQPGADWVRQSLKHLKNLLRTSDRTTTTTTTTTTTATTESNQFDGWFIAIEDISNVIEQYRASQLIVIDASTSDLSASTSTISTSTSSTSSTSTSASSPSLFSQSTMSSSKAFSSIPNSEPRFKLINSDDNDGGFDGDEDDDDDDDNDDGFEFEYEDDAFEFEFDDDEDCNGLD